MIIPRRNRSKTMYTSLNLRKTLNKINKQINGQSFFGITAGYTIKIVLLLLKPNLMDFITFGIKVRNCDKS